MKKLLAVLLSVMMIMSLAACAQPAAPEAEAEPAPAPEVEAEPTPAPAEPTFTAGTYTSVQQGNNGPLTVEVTFSDDAVTAVAVPEHSESPRIGETAINAVAEAVVSMQTLDVDAVSGSTVTYSAVMRGLYDCVAQAGGEASDFGPNTTPVQADEEITTQIVVVGAGGAGMSAAVEAAQLGAEVVVLEKLASIGGSTGHSSGVYLYTDEGFTPDDYVDLHLARANSDEAIVRRLANDATPNLEWLTEMGWVWYARPQLVDNTWNAARANPDFDGKSVRPNGMTIIDALERGAIEAGNVDIQVNTAGKELIVEDGQVVGVIAERKDGSKLTVYADAVILATGGFDNGDIMETLQPAIRNAKHVSAVGNVGDGIKMIEAVGGYSSYTCAALGQGNTNWLNTYNLPENFLEVNGDGVRICAEDCHYMVEMNAMLASANPKFAYLFDSNNDVTIMEQHVADGKMVKADTIEELAEKLNINVDGLKATIENYNAMCEAGEDTEFGKAPELMLGFGEAPFYGVEAAAEILLSFGGPVVNAECQFLTEAGDIIPGVYGAGELTNSLVFVSGYSYGGGAIHQAIGTGRIAAQNAVADHLTEKFTAGTYTSTQQGREPLTVAVTFTDGRIADIAVEHTESPRIGETAINTIINTVIPNQTLDVDAVSGSTVTYSAVMRGIYDCLAQAGGSPADLKAYSAPVKADAEIETDIVVVGAGGAGMSAAVEAAQLGAEVVVLEKLASIGGSTGHSSGVYLYTDEGFTPDDYVDLHLARANSDEAIVRRLAEAATPNLEWLTEMGWVWYARPQLVDNTWNAARANPDIDGKSVRPNGMTIIDALERGAIEAGNIDIQVNTAGKELIVENGQVVGVIAERKDGSKLTVKAKAVILATGGFDNGDIMETLQPAIRNANHVSAVGNVGDGIKMIEAVGGYSLYTCEALGQGNTNWLNTYNLPENFLEVNGDGVRICAEDCHYMVEMNAMLASANPKFAYLFDSNNDVTIMEQHVADGKMVKADTIEELAEKLNINVDGLKATIEHYNEMCEDGEDKDFGKAPELMLGFGEAPFYGVEAAAEILLSFGGPVVNAECEFLTEAGDIIPGVYGAGELTNSLVFVSGYSYGGGAIHQAIGTGRIAAQNAVANYVK